MCQYRSLVVALQQQKKGVPTPPPLPSAGAEGARRALMTERGWASGREMAVVAQQVGVGGGLGIFSWLSLTATLSLTRALSPVVETVGGPRVQ